MDQAALKAELTTGHPDTGAYDVTHHGAAVELNEANRTRPRKTVSGSQVLNAIHEAEFLLLTDQQQARVWNILHLGTLNPWGMEADLLVNLFGVGSATITALALLRVESISRAVELGFAWVNAGHVQRARGS